MTRGPTKEAITVRKAVVAPILQDLRNVGFSVGSIEELARTRTRYQSAIPVLLSWLPKTQEPHIKEALVRALSFRWAKPNPSRSLLSEFSRTETQEFALRWAIANALSIVATDDVYADIASLINDKNYGKAREMLVVSLGNMRRERPVGILIDLLSDRDLCGYALMALGRLKAVEARSNIETFLNHPTTWVREQAKVALRKIDASCLNSPGNVR